MKQYAYAKRRLGGEGQSMKDIALASGYAPSVADKPTEKIESTEGFHNAMSALASETGNVALKILHEIKGRDISKEPLTNLLNAVNVLANAWDHFTPKPEKSDIPAGNRLRGIRLAKIVEPKTESIAAPKSE